mmetsp:Transcript_119352/g.210921  ORF Transcript_119352/g.210921 Transcript_119352/m.210921 type:complete len:213 (-) Transcript_119352:2111-2749(-)
MSSSTHLPVASTVCLGNTGTTIHVDGGPETARLPTILSVLPSTLLLSSTSRKSRSVVTDTCALLAKSSRWSICSFCASEYASWHRAATSAPVKFEGHALATLCNSGLSLMPFSSSKSNFRVTARSSGSLSLAMPRYTIRSRRPGRNNERSKRSGRLVAPMRKTVDGKPSSSVSSCDTTRSMTPPESLPRPRAGARESNSSKKTTHGCNSLAL